MECQGRWVSICFKAENAANSLQKVNNTTFAALFNCVWSRHFLQGIHSVRSWRQKSGPWLSVIIRDYPWLSVISKKAVFLFGKGIFSRKTTLIRRIPINFEMYDNYNTVERSWLLPPRPCPCPRFLPVGTGEEFGGSSRRLGEPIPLTNHL